MNKRLFAALLFLTTLAACVKPPVYPDVPVIKFERVTTGLVKSGAVDTIIFSFTDGNGDIGVVPVSGDTCNPCNFKNGDSTCLRLQSFNVFLIDSRDSCLVTESSATIPQEGSFDDISGEIMVIRTMFSQKCFVTPQPGCPLDTVVYTIILRDRAGNYSNAVNTTPIIIDGE